MKPPVIHDCFTYAGEDDLLLLRLQTLDAVVGRFVIAEGTRTFKGAPRTPCFDRTRFAAWADRIEYVLVDDMDPSPASAWHNEYHQRNALARGLAKVRSRDWVVLGDVDEIPHPDALRRFEPRRWWTAVLQQRMYYYAINNEMVRSADPSDVPWCRVRITTAGRLRRWYGTMQNLRDFRDHGPWRSVRRWWHKRRTQHIEAGGWHFSYLMTPEQIRRKIESFSHQELNLPQFTSDEHIRAALRERRDLFGGDRHFEVVPVDESFPAPLRADPERWRRWVLE